MDLFFEYMSYLFPVLVILLFVMAPHNSGAEVGKKFTIDITSSSVGDYLSADYANRINDVESSSFRFNRALRKNPTNHLLLESSYKLSLLSGNIDEAVTLAKEYLEYDEGAISASIIIALEAIKKKDYGTSEKIMADIVSGDRLVIVSGIDLVLMKFMHLWSLVGQDKLEEADLLIDKMKTKGDVPLGILELHAALIKDLSGKEQEARIHYQNVIKDKDTSYSFIKLVGNFLERTGESDKAKELYTKYRNDNYNLGHFTSELEGIKKAVKPSPLVLGPSQGVIEIMKEAARAMFKNNLYKEGLAYVRMVNYLNPEEEESNIMLAGYFENNERYADAIAIYDSIKNDSDLAGVARVSKAEDLYLMGKVKESVEEFTILAKTYSDSYYPELIYADLLRRKSKFSEAIEVYDKIIASIKERKSRQSDWAIYFARAICLERSDRWARAEKDLIKALELKPDDPEVLNYLGYSWIDRGKNIEKAKNMVEQAVKLRPNDAQMVDSMGWVLFKLNDYDKASMHLERALEISPTDSILNDHLGDVYWKQGRYREARFQWKKALKYDNSESPAEEKTINDIKKKLEYGLKD